MDLQALINSQASYSKLELPPGEFLGPIVVDRPITIVGKGKSTWIGSSTSPTVRIISARVQLQDMVIECTAAGDAVAVDAGPGTNPTLEQVIVKGTIKGVRPEKVSFAGTPRETVPLRRPDPLPPPPRADVPRRVPSGSPLEPAAPDGRRQAVSGRGAQERSDAPMRGDVPRPPTSRANRRSLFTKLAVAAVGLVGVGLFAALWPGTSPQQVAPAPQKIGRASCRERV